MQFRLPQFLDIEDKVFGPFTFKQFGYLLGAIAFAYIFWKLIPIKVISIFFILIFSGTFLALAFVKVNNRPFADILESAYKFLIGGKTYVWQKEQKIEKKEEEKSLRHTLIKKDEPVPSKQVTFDRIRELSSKLDILDEKKKQETSLRDSVLYKNK